MQDESEGAWTTDGHYYTVQLIALMMGFTPEEASNLAVEAEEPDSKVSAPWDMQEKYTWLIAGLQQQYHVLTGRKHGVELALTSYAMLRTHINEQSADKYLLHRFGDCFGHVDTKEKTFDLQYSLNSYADAVDNLFTQYVLPKLKLVKDDYKVTVDVIATEGMPIVITKSMGFLKIFYNGKNLLTTLSVNETKRELVEQLLHCYSDETNLNSSHNLYIRNELIEELEKGLPSAVQNNYQMYGNNYGFTLGHSIDNKLGHNPDDIGQRKKLYLYYIDKLIELLSSKYNKTGFDDKQIKEDLKSIINYASNGSSPKRLDGVLAFECVHYDNKKSNNYTFSIPIKYNAANMTFDQKAIDNSDEAFEKEAKEQLDILITYLQNRMIIDRISWKPNSSPSSTLDRNNYPKFDYIPELIQGNFYIESLVTKNKKSIQIKVLRK